MREFYDAPCQSGVIYRSAELLVMVQKMKKILLAFILCPFIFQNSFASEEGVLTFSKFLIESKGIGESGPVTVEGQKDELGKYTQLKINAFGKIQEVPKKILNQVSKYQNGIQLSYEAGYQQLGGKTIYITFHMGFTSGIKETIIISVSENREPEIIKNMP